MGRSWNPWAALRDRPHLTLRWAHLPGDVSGVLVEADGQRTVLLDARLGRRERSAVLGHELVHDERGLLYTPSTPAALVEKEEEAVNRETARRLVPLDELRAFVERRAEVEPVTAATVCEEFDVHPAVAARALRLLSQ